MKKTSAIIAVVLAIFSLVYFTNVSFASKATGGAVLLTSSSHSGSLESFVFDLTTNSVAQVDDQIDIATDAAFTNIIFSRGNVPSGVTPSVSYTTGNIYFWRLLNISNTPPTPSSPTYMQFTAP